MRWINLGIFLTATLFVSGCNIGWLGLDGYIESKREIIYQEGDGQERRTNLYTLIQPISLSSFNNYVNDARKEALDKYRNGDLSTDEYFSINLRINEIIENYKKYGGFKIDVVQDTQFKIRDRVDFYIGLGDALLGDLILRRIMGLLPDSVMQRDPLYLYMSHTTRSSLTNRKYCLHRAD